MSERVSSEHKIEQLQALAEMQNLSNDYYRRAQAIGIHTFIEHAGFINEHIKILSRALIDHDVDIAMLNNHTGGSIQVHDYEAAYLAEKFACMFAPIFKSRAAWKAFVKEAEREGCGAEDE